jgi:hypothetical protein
VASHPTATGTAITWLRTFLPAVASNLPDISTWPIVIQAGNTLIRGFVTVPAVAGGAGRDTPLRVPVFGVEAWAGVPSSDVPQYGAAEQLAEVIVAEIYNDDAYPRLLTQRAGYNAALVQSARLLTEPRRLDDPDTGYARYVMDLELAWVEVPA